MVCEKWSDTRKDSRRDITDFVIEKIKYECSLTENTKTSLKYNGKRPFALLAIKFKKGIIDDELLDSHT